ncbi:MAG: hypothetical protein ACLU38_05360 [Dysosmobacter sp.]
MDALADSWDGAQDYLHVVIHHETLDAAQVTCPGADPVPAEQGMTCCRSCAAAQQLELLDELERLTCGTFYTL